MAALSHPTLDWEHAVFLGNINRELEHIEVKDQVLQLLLCLGVTIADSDLEVRYSKTSAAYIAFVNLGQRDMQKYVYDSLSGDSQSFVDGLVQEGRRLKVDYYRKLGDGQSGTSVRLVPGQHQNQDQVQNQEQQQNEVQIQNRLQNQSEVTTESLDLSLEVLGRSIQLESRASQQSNAYEPYQGIGRNQLSNINRGQQGQESGVAQRRSVSTLSQNAGEMAGNWDAGRVQGEIPNRPLLVDLNQDRTRPDGVSVESVGDENASGPSGSSQVASLPPSTSSIHSENKPAVVAPPSGQQTGHGQSGQSQKKRRKKRRARPNNQQRYIGSSDSDSDDRLSTGTFTLEEGESFLNTTYTLEKDQAYLESLPAPASTSEPRGASPRSRPPSRLPRLKNRPPKTENPGGLKKLSPASAKETTPKPQQAVVPKRSSSPIKRPPTRANSSAAGNGGQFYTVGQKLGSESRHLEFKAGGGDFFKRFFKEHIGRYVCAFLNSEGGSLMIGVADDGSVQGVHCDQLKEDRIRRDIDSVIRHFKPQVFTEMYSVDFVPVKNQRLGPLKVVKITVKTSMSDTLYENDKGEVYLRRDGSVQGPLKAHEIKEWCRLHHQKEVEVMKQREQDLEREMELQKEVEAKLRSDLTKYQKSKVCVIL